MTKENNTDTMTAETNLIKPATTDETRYAQLQDAIADNQEHIDALNHFCDAYKKAYATGIVPPYERKDDNENTVEIHPGGEVSKENALRMVNNLTLWIGAFEADRDVLRWNSYDRSLNALPTPTKRVNPDLSLRGISARMQGESPMMIQLDREVWESQLPGAR